MTAMNQVKEYLATLPEEQPFPSNALRRIASTDNIRQILNRLVKAGELVRLARGVFAKPRHTKAGVVLPSARATVETLAKSRGETVVIQGAEAARQLQLTTQVPLRTIFYTSGNSRTLKIANRTVELKHTTPRRLIAPGTVPGLIISALQYLGRENVTTLTIKKIKQQVSEKEFKTALSLRDSMPAWMSDAFYRYLQENKNGS
jgi:hypothetical protein